MFKTLFELEKYRNNRISHISNSICNVLKTEKTVTPLVVFSMAFIWHCHIHFTIDLFDNNDDIYNLYLRYTDISNKDKLFSFFLSSKCVFKDIKKSRMKKAVKLFEADNGDMNNAPHGYIASAYNIKEITNEFTKYMNYTLNDDEANELSSFLSCL